MAKAGKKIYYWDTACFIAWLDGAKGHPKDVISGLDEIAKEVTANRAILCTSVATQTEILQGKMSPEQSERLENLFKRRNVISINLDTRIAKRASEIRNFYHEREIKLSVPDCQHLATAILYEADEFHTLDGDGKRQRPNDLLRLNGDVAGYPLHIRVPTAVQGSLLAGVGPLQLENIGGENVKHSEKVVEPSPALVQGSSDRAPESSPAKQEINPTSETKTEEEKELEKKEGPPSL
jgi:predicted nucleic acid-binding protein